VLAVLHRDLPSRDEVLFAAERSPPTRETPTDLVGVGALTLALPSPVRRYPFAIPRV
jgi:hypothetical protein